MNVVLGVSLVAPCVAIAACLLAGGVSARVTSTLVLLVASGGWTVLLLDGATAAVGTIRPDGVGAAAAIGVLLVAAAVIDVPRCPLAVRLAAAGCAAAVPVLANTTIDDGAARPLWALAVAASFPLATAGLVALLDRGRGARAQVLALVVPALAVVADQVPRASGVDLSTATIEAAAISAAALAAVVGLASIAAAARRVSVGGGFAATALLLVAIAALLLPATNAAGRLLAAAATITAGWSAQRRPATWVLATALPGAVAFGAVAAVESNRPVVAVAALGAIALAAVVGGSRPALHARRSPNGTLARAVLAAVALHLVVVPGAWRWAGDADVVDYERGIAIALAAGLIATAAVAALRLRSPSRT